MTPPTQSAQSQLVSIPTHRKSASARPRWLDAERFTREPWLVRWVLVMGLLHGLSYIFLVPPWQHYEEPAHFEYAWMIYIRRAVPGPLEYDNTIRHALLSSMIEYDFYRGLPVPPNPEVSDQPLSIGFSQTGTAPLYHIFMTLPLSLFAQADVVTRLYAVRFVSLTLYVLTLWIAYRCLAELIPEGNPLRWTVPAGLALLPAFTDIMTAFNDDVGAVLVFSLYLWATTRLIMRGPSPVRLLSVLVLAVACVWTKTTVLLALPLAPVAIGLALMRRRWHALYWAVPLLAAIVVALSVFSWGGAASWYEGGPPAPVRVSRPEAAWGRQVLALHAVLPGGPQQVQQPLLARDVEALRGQPFTLGAWMWASTPGPAELPSLWDGRQWLSQSVTVGTQPAFYALRGTLPDDARGVKLLLSAGRPASGESERVVYYDGLVLAAGDFPVDRSPEFADAQARQGRWDGRVFANYVRNASAEDAAPHVRPWAVAQFEHYAEAYLSPSILVAALFDLPRSTEVYSMTGQRLLQTFWARFAWGQIGLADGWYTVLGGITALALAGGVFSLGRTFRRKPLPWTLALAWLGLATLALWGAVLVRGLFTVLDPSVYVPSARYAFPVIIPTMLLLMAGWQALLGRPAGARLLVLVWGLQALDLISLSAIYRYYLGG